jgi:hypothetical protein
MCLPWAYEAIYLSKRSNSYGGGGGVMCQDIRKSPNPRLGFGLFLGAAA